MNPIVKIFSWNEVRSSHRLMMLMVFVLGLLNFFWGEKVPAGGGFGWDGIKYADMVRNLDVMISEGRLSSYYAQRILPSAIVRGMLLVSGVSLNDVNIIRGFELYNLTLLIGACWIWKRVADNFSLSVSGRWIGFVSIFLNFQSSKQSFYYPVLTDVTALFVALLLLLFYIRKKPAALFFTTVIGSLCWPVVSVCGALLLFFLGCDLPKGMAVRVESALTSKWFSTLSLVKLIGTILVLSILVYLLWIQIYQNLNSSALHSIINYMRRQIQCK